MTFPLARHPRQKLLVFARYPELGRVKTRLAAGLGHERTLAAYRAMVADLLDGIGESSAGTEVEVMWTASPDVTGEQLRSCFGNRALAMQAGATLGDRLGMAFCERIFFHEASKVVAIGVDDPAIDRPFLDLVLQLLDSCEWVIGPASDGGYYLIGCRADAFFPEIFQEIEWGTSSVLDATVAKIHRKQQSLATLPVRNDIDHLDDLQRYGATAGPGRVRELLEQWGWIT